MTDFNCTIQELKRRSDSSRYNPARHFNCTIQELKRTVNGITGSFKRHFNCTIQELKHGATALKIKKDRFQLHHTGIKTVDGSVRQMLEQIISIAPYRN